MGGAQQLSIKMAERLLGWHRDFPGMERQDGRCSAFRQARRPGSTGGLGLSSKELEECTVFAALPVGEAAFSGNIERCRLKTRSLVIRRKGESPLVMARHSRPVCNTHQRRGGEVLAQELIHVAFGLLIECGRGLIEEQPLRLIEQRAGNGEPLLLSRRQA